MKAIGLYDVSSRYRFLSSCFISFDHSSEEPAPTPLADEVVNHAVESPPRPTPTQANHGDAPSGKVESALALISGDAGPSKRPSRGHGL